MSNRRALLSLLAGLLLAGLLAGLAACEQKATSNAAGAPDWAGIFGDGYPDRASPVIARVGDLEIRRSDLEKRYDELPGKLRNEYSGPEGERRFVRYMVDEALLVREAMRRKLYLEPGVRQNLISQFRQTMKTVMANRELLKDQEPSEQQIEEFFNQHRGDYVREGAVHARTIVCPTQERAWAAYDEIRRQRDEDPNAYLKAVARYSTNYESAKQGGDLGWFGKGGQIPALPYGRQFAEAVWNRPIDLLEPMEIGGEWHVVEILDRDFERQYTLDEVRDRVIADLVPGLQSELVDAFLRDARQRTKIEYFGEFQPGQGRSPRELFELAWYASDVNQRLANFELLLEDYPQDELADDALFMMANIHLDRWGDVRRASSLLRRLLAEYPDSELYEDAEYILQHMNDPDFRKPHSVEDLRPSRQGD